MSTSISAPFQGTSDSLSSAPSERPWLRLYSKLVCAAVLTLIFFGALVTSHDAGLSVPDWPTTYGENMFMYSPSKWVGPIFYEHVHRLIASGIGALTVVLFCWLWATERRRWVKVLGSLALVAVIAQGLLGGLTVLMKLPDAVSIAHGMLAQTFFCLTIILAYSQSKELQLRISSKQSSGSRTIFNFALVVLGVIFVQLFLGAYMRHSGAGLAVPDFPTAGGKWWPSLDDQMLAAVNQMREAMSLAPVTLQQVIAHVIHRLWALVVAGTVISFMFTVQRGAPEAGLRQVSVWLTLGILVQFALGVVTVMSARQPYLTSLHVMVGAFVLGMTVLACLRSFPLTRGAANVGNS